MGESLSRTASHRSISPSQVAPSLPRVGIQHCGQQPARRTWEAPSGKAGTWMGLSFHLRRRTPRQQTLMEPVAGTCSQGYQEIRATALPPPAIADGGLPTMAGSAEGLPVAGIPEQGGIALVGDDVVGDGRGHHAPLLHTPDAQGISLQVGLRGDALLTVVAAGSRVPAPPVVLALLLFPVEVAHRRLGQGRAARVAAGTLRSKRAHAAFLFSWTGSFASRFHAASSPCLIRDRPFSSTYPRRRRSSLYTACQSAQDMPMY